MKRAISVLGLTLAVGLSGQADAQTLKTVRDRGSLICGVSQGLPGFSSPDDKGNWTGIDVDLCRAVAAAIFNDPSKVKFTPLSAKDRFEPLRSGEIDVGPLFCPSNRASVTGGPLLSAGIERISVVTVPKASPCE